MKRSNVLSWESYFMGIAHLSALRSKDPNTQVGAVIVDEDKMVFLKVVMMMLIHGRVLVQP